ncbi:hypothetical protein B484DRAFT_448360 [Ochromonadaceae sp. CCMP2298]|nr:hypothetical protein B484DRAFT_448360 [Ochromonadaceae sp. CCMP2298]
MYPNNHLFVQEAGQVVLLIIDPQNDFHDDPTVSPDDPTSKKGSLAVTGSTEQAKRVAQFIRDNTHRIGEIFITLDSHHKRHIAHKAFWSSIENDLAHKGKSPVDFQQISNQDLLDDKWFPKDTSLQEYVLKYTRRLERVGGAGAIKGEGGDDKDDKRFKLTIWPDHCLIGSGGHAIQDDIQKAVREWDVAHPKKYVKHIHKGMNCLTEMYSAIKAEVPIVSDSTTTKNEELLDELRKSGRLLICGQALSHCVRFTATDILHDWEEYAMLNCEPADFAKIYILEDASASVYGYDESGAEFLQMMRNKGCTVTKLANALDDWCPAIKM